MMLTTQKRGRKGKKKTRKNSCSSSSTDNEVTSNQKSNQKQSIVENKDTYPFSDAFKFSNPDDLNKSKINEFTQPPTTTNAGETVLLQLSNMQIKAQLVDNKENSAIDMEGSKWEYVSRKTRRQNTQDTLRSSFDDSLPENNTCITQVYNKKARSSSEPFKSPNRSHCANTSKKALGKLGKIETRIERETKKSCSPKPKAKQSSIHEPKKAKEFEASLSITQDQSLDLPPKMIENVHQKVECDNTIALQEEERKRRLAEIELQKKQDIEERSRRQEYAVLVTERERQRRIDEQQQWVMRELQERSRNWALVRAMIEAEQQRIQNEQQQWNAFEHQDKVSRMQSVTIAAEQERLRRVKEHDQARQDGEHERTRRQQMAKQAYTEEYKRLHLSEQAEREQFLQERKQQISLVQSSTEEERARRVREYEVNAQRHAHMMHMDHPMLAPVVPTPILGSVSVPVVVPVFSPAPQLVPHSPLSNPHFPCSPQRPPRYKLNKDHHFATHYPQVQSPSKRQPILYRSSHTHQRFEQGEKTQEDITCANATESSNLDSISSSKRSNTKVDDYEVINSSMAAMKVRSVAELGPRVSSEWRQLYEQLHSEIVAFYQSTHCASEKLRPVKQVAVKSIRQIVNQLWPRAQADVYGSFATGLSLPSSDVDLVLKGLPAEENTVSLLRKLACVLHEQPWIHTLVVAEHSVVPVIRVTTCFSIRECTQTESEIQTSPTNATYFCKNGKTSPKSTPKVQSTEAPFESVAKSETPTENTSSTVEENTSDDTTQDRAFVSLDISIDMGGHQGMAQNDLVRRLMSDFPCLQPLILVLKHLLLHLQLNNPLTGGLSSYSIFLMVANVVQKRHESGLQCSVESSVLGEVLVELMWFFGFGFDPERHVLRLSVISTGYKEILQNK